MLDSYDAERRPNAAAVLAFTGQLTTVAGIRGADDRALRDDVLRSLSGVDRFAPAIARRMAQLDISCRRPDDDRPDPVGRRLPPEGAWAKQYAWATVPRAGGGELTVRPDGYVAAVSNGG